MLVQFMHNRPYAFTKYCLKNKFDQFTDEGRIAKIEDTSFFVKSLQNDGKSYNVELKDDNGFLSCECEDWLPCKHMFFLFNGKTELDRKALPQSY